MVNYTLKKRFSLLDGNKLKNLIPMRTTLCVLAALFLFACSKKMDDANLAPSSKYSGYNEYLIPKGKNYCNNNSYPEFKGSSVAFNVIFDSSAIYQTVQATNQLDINKLYGIADCGTHHQENSARFGWRWNGSAVDILAYYYVNSVRKNQLLGTAAIGEVNKYILSVEGKSYKFQFNDKVVTVERHCDSQTFDGYVLYPYFGGDEPAPHNISIYINFKP